MKKGIIAVIVIVIVLAAVVINRLYFAGVEEPPQTKEVSLPPPAAVKKAPEIKHPIYEIQVGARQREMPAVKQEAIPKLHESDEPVRKALAGFIDPQKLQSSIVFKNVIRRFVVTVDNLTNKKLPQNYRFVAAVPGKFAVKPGAAPNHYTLSARNYARYDGLVNLAESVNLKQLVILYTRYYPLFQQAYEELGYPGRYFNDRLVEVIGHLLAAPEPAGPVRLVQPKVFYEFADPDMEKLSAGQKIMIRIGPDNERRVKAVLRKLLGLLVKP
jgi:hypothetical protein